jgi:diadenylate cyclase
MDGAIIIDSKLKKIMYANTLLVPDSKIKTDETGTKHRAAERTAKQLGVIVIAVSEKSSLISVYYGNNHYILNDLNVLLSKARGAVENLEEQKAEIELILKRFDSLEISSLVSTKDLAQVIDKIILFFRDCETAATYTAELGTYGETLKTRYSIALSGLREELNNLIRDYNRFFDMNKVVESIKDLKVPTMDKSIKILNKFARDEDVEMQKTTLLPLGYRIFSKCNLTKDEIENLVSNFKDIKRILYVDSNEIVKLGIDEKNVKSMKSFLSGRVEII